jgi:hypothetical protein
MFVLVVTTVVAISLASSFAMKDDMATIARKGRTVVRCRLDGLNPVQHPEIFGNAAVARSDGFVRSRDDSWHVAPNCRR